MIGKILKSTKGKPCSCPTGKICTGCKKKKVVQPQIFIDEPTRPVTKPSPIKYKQSSVVQYIEKPKQWKTYKRRKYEPQKSKSSPICRWYRRRKALKELVAEYEKEKKLEKQRRHEEYERERIEELINWEKRYRKKSLPPSWRNYEWEEKPEKKLPLTTPKKKVVYVKETSAVVKPRAQSKYVSVKKTTHRESITKRFVNYCYRLCCQLYCYLTLILLIIVIIIFIV